MARMARTVLAAMAMAAGAAASTGCASDGDYTPRLGPGYVEVGENRRFGVSYSPEFQTALLSFTIVGSFAVGAETPEPPTEDEWRAAAEEAAPEGCTVAGIEQVAEDAYRATFDCGEAS